MAQAKIKKKLQVYKTKHKMFNHTYLHTFIQLNAMYI